MSRFVKAAKHLKFAGDASHPDDASLDSDHQLLQHQAESDDLGRITARSSVASATSPVRPSSFGSRLSSDEHEHIIQLGGSRDQQQQQPGSPQPGAHSSHARRRGHTLPTNNSHNQPLSPTASPPLNPAAAHMERAASPSRSSSEPALGEGSLSLDLFPQQQQQQQQGAHQNNGGFLQLPPTAPHLVSGGSVPDIAVQMASPPEQHPVSPSMPRRLSDLSDASDEARSIGRPRSTSNLSSLDHSNNASDKQQGRPRSSSAFRKRPTSPSSASSSPRGPAAVPMPAKPGRSFTVGSASSSSSNNNKRDKDSSNVASGGIGSALALGGFTLGAPGSAGHPGMNFQHQFPPSPQRSRAGSMVDGKEQSRDDLGLTPTLTGDSQGGGGGGASGWPGRQDSLDAQMLDDFGYIDDVDLGSGYALAGIKRNQEFHQLFETVPEHDALIEDYGCALWKDILTQGRLYISEHHLCFYANILGWITNLVIPFSEVISIEKRMTAYVIPNAITVKTLHVHHTFASFLSRDTTYTLIVDIWSKSHPNIPPGAALPDHEGHTLSDEDSAAEEDPSVEEAVSLSPAAAAAATATAAASGAAAPPPAPAPSKRSRLRMRRGAKSAAAAPSVSDTQANGSGAVPNGSKTPPPALKKGPTMHRVTNIPSSVTTFKDVCMDATFAGSPEKIYNLLFTSEGFIRDFWANNQHLTEIEIGEWKPSEKQLLERNVSYIKPLNAPVGPKSMKCYITDANENVDFDDYISVLTTTKTPDAPSGNAFATKTRTCITWAPNNCCRVLVTTTVEWYKSSFLKGVITSSALDGQKTYHTELVKVIKAYMQAHKSEFQHSSGGEDISEDVADAVDEEPVSDPIAEGATSVKSAPFIQPFERIIEPLKGAFEFLFELATSNSVAAGIIALLLLFNVITLFTRGSSEIDTVPGSRVRAPPGSHLRSPDEVAEAVKGVLHEYFSPADAHRLGKSSSTTAAPVNADKRDLNPADELADIYSTLEALEDRIARLRGTLAVSA